jgi:carbonic anhydrase
MCGICLKAHRGSMTRRGALGLTVSALAAGLIVPRAMAANDKPPPKPQNVIAPDAALDRLMKGNNRYVTGVSLLQA